MIRILQFYLYWITCSAFVSASLK